MMGEEPRARCERQLLDMLAHCVDLADHLDQHAVAALAQHAVELMTGLGDMKGATSKDEP